MPDKKLKSRRNRLPSLKTRHGTGHLALPRVCDLIQN
jgi:hypothetical protein